MAVERDQVDQSGGSRMNELETAIKRASYGRTSKFSNVPSSKAVIDDPAPPQPVYPKVIDIKRAVAEYFSLEMLDLDCGRRGISVVRPRQIAMYLYCRLTAHSLPEIGRRMGGKDHTTVLHSSKKIKQLMEFETPRGKELRETVEQLKATILAKVQNGQAK